jgi:hypothetical protein
VKKRRKAGLDFVIDKLTNSIENRVTGDSLPTNVILLTRNDLKTLTKKNGWAFDWRYEMNQPEREVYKLTVVENPEIVQGVMSLETRFDHVYMHLIENAPFNKGREKMYEGVPGNLVAFACRLSFQRGFEGNVSFISKTQLINHYTKTLGAFHAGNRVMIIDTQAAFNLVEKYFKNLAL